MCDKKTVVTRRIIFLTVMVVLMAVAIGYGEEGAASAQSAPQAQPAKPAPEEGNAAISMAADGKIQSISFKKDADIRDVLRFLGAKYNKNIVPSPKVEGPITVTNLYDVTFNEAMDAIMGDNYVWKQRGNIIEVFTREDKSRMTYKVFTLSYITAEEAKKIITPILSSVGQVGFSTPAQRGVPTGESISQASGGDTIATSDTIVIFDYPERIEKAEKIMKEVDVRPKQVLIEATILSVLLTEGMELGVDLNLFGGIGITGTDKTEDIFDPLTHQLISRGSPAGPPIGQVAVGGAGTPIETSGFAAKARSDGLRLGIAGKNDVSAFITALEQVTDTTILANPKILAVNKQLGEVYIGTKIGYIDMTNQTQTSTTQSVKYLDTGTKLSFRPYIGDDGYIRMDIHPKDSTGNLKANNIPDETSTELATNVVVKDGETIVIGGLFRDVIISARKQIPILGDLPFIGAAFRNTTDTVQRQEIIVLLTPHIINEAADTNPQARMNDIRLKREAAKEELQWIDRARQAEDRYAKAVKLYLENNKEQALKEVNGALELRPAYLEALRLKERIIKEANPQAAANINSVMQDKVELKDSEKWLRR
jgi:type IV pilus assembly protein PilQ